MPSRRAREVRLPASEPVSGSVSPKQPREVPAAIRLALDGADYDAFVALGCVIRGETSHYDIVAGESARGLMDLAVQRGALIGNGILTTDDGRQARVRADPDGKDKGGAAARAALALLQIKRCFRL